MLLLHTKQDYYECMLDHLVKSFSTWVNEKQHWTSKSSTPACKFSYNKLVLGLIIYMYYCIQGKWNDVISQ